MMKDGFYMYRLCEQLLRRASVEPSTFGFEIDSDCYKRMMLTVRSMWGVLGKFT